MIAVLRLAFGTRLRIGPPAGDDRVEIELRGHSVGVAGRGDRRLRRRGGGARTAGRARAPGPAGGRASLALRRHLALIRGRRLYLEARSNLMGVVVVDLAPLDRRPGGGPDASGLHVEMLGRFVVRIDGRDVTEALVGRSRVVFQYLVLTGGPPVPRDVLIDVCWPEFDVERGRNNLNVAITGIRRALGYREIVRHRSGAYRIDPDIETWIDVVELHRVAPGGAPARRRPRRGGHRPLPAGGVALPGRAAARGPLLRLGRAAAAGSWSTPTSTPSSGWPPSAATPATCSRRRGRPSSGSWSTTSTRSWSSRGSRRWSTAGPTGAWTPPCARTRTGWRRSWACRRRTALLALAAESRAAS